MVYVALQVLLCPVLINDFNMNEILATHFIEPDLLRADDFEAFISARQQQLLMIISRVMGKTLSDDNIV